MAKQNSIRGRILTFVGALVLLSLLGSTFSLYRITEVNRILDVINRVSVPLGRLFVQVQADADIYQREFDRSLGQSHWRDPHWIPHSVPRWVVDVMDAELGKVSEFLAKDSSYPPGVSDDVKQRWKAWAASVQDEFNGLKEESAQLEIALVQKDEAGEARSFSRFTSQLEEWKRQLQWGANEYDRSYRQSFAITEKRVSDLRTGLELILIAVVSLSFMLLWLGERALRPLGDLTRLAREITRRGLKKEDKSLLPEISLTRTDEVSQLSREFHNMATALLEREKTVELQKHRLLEQNNLMRNLGELNENVLNSIEGILIVTDLSGAVTQLNPVAERWLGEPAEKIRGRHHSEFLKLERLLGFHPEARAWLGQLDSRFVIRPTQSQQLLEGRRYGGHLMPLKAENGEARGAIWVLDDVTDELDIQERLRRAENLAAVGRMSAQVAHEVRNPLHSIGLEAEMAIEMVSGAPALKQSLQSILGSVDRLEKIIANYLAFSKLSPGIKSKLDLGEVLEAALATYAPACEAKKVNVDWRREKNSNLAFFGDGDLLQQVLGNLIQNSLQALELIDGPRKIELAMGSSESGRVWLRIEDNGLGIPEEVRAKLFVPFVTTRAQGTGLGLSFVKKVIEEHGGSISLLSRGRGACFEIALPGLASNYPQHFQDENAAKFEEVSHVSV